MLVASPNPFSNYLSIDFQGVVEDGATFVLLSADGRMLQNKALQHGANRLETVALPVGAYFLVVKNGGKVRVDKLMKK